MISKRLSTPLITLVSVTFIVFSLGSTAFSQQAPRFDENKILSVKLLENVESVFRLNSNFAVAYDTDLVSRSLAIETLDEFEAVFSFFLDAGAKRPLFMQDRKLNVNIVKGHSASNGDRILGVFLPASESRPHNSIGLSIFNNRKTIETLRGTIAHELYHALQHDSPIFKTDPLPRNLHWFAEATAKAMEIEYLQAWHTKGFSKFSSLAN